MLRSKKKKKKKSTRKRAEGRVVAQDLPHREIETAAADSPWRTSFVTRIRTLPVVPP